MAGWLYSQQQKLLLFQIFKHKKNQEHVPVVDIIDTCSVEEFVMSADMYGLEAVKVVANSFIRREYCQ
jgi:hypothetical protein